MRKGVFTYLLVIIYCLSTQALFPSDQKKLLQNFIFLNKKISDYKVKGQSFRLPTGHRVIPLSPHGFFLLDEDRDVFAYSLQENWTRESILPEALNAILQHRTGDNTAQWNHAFRQWPASSPSTTGWITTTWHQREPFNQFCPLDPTTGQRSVASCGAVCLAQLLNYHETAASLRLFPRDQYTTPTHKIRLDADSTNCGFPSFQRLNKIVSQIDQNYQSDRVLDETHIAALQFASGVTLKTDYTSDESTLTVNMAHALREKTELTCDDLQVFDHQSWQQLKQNMMNGLPAILFLPGHAVLADGYNTDGFVHLNFGWGTKRPEPIRSAWFSLSPHPVIDAELVVHAITNIRSSVLHKPQLDVSPDPLWVKAFNTGSQSESVPVTIENLTAGTVNVDFILCPEQIKASLDNVVFRDSLPGFVLSGHGQKKLYLTYWAQNADTCRGDMLIAYDDEKRFLCRDITASLGPTRGTVISGGHHAETWSKSGSPYNIMGDVVVSSGSLVIEPGVDVVFRGEHKLIVKRKGQLIARGTLDDSVRFRPLNPTINWSGINIWSSGQDDTLSYCSITGSRSPDWGGGLWIADSGPVIRHCRISDNRAVSGGGIYLWQASPVIKNTLICRNRAEYGGGIYAEFTSAPSLINVTIADNRAYHGGGFYGNINNHCDFTNTIIWNNSAERGSQFSTSSTDTLDFHYCDVDTSVAKSISWRTSPGHTEWNETNLCADPQFANYYMLAPASPCIDAGHPDSRFSDDSETAASNIALWPGQGTPRNDLGAFGGPQSGRQLSSGVSKDMSQSSIHVTELQANYPNPFNSATTISFSIAHPGKVHLDIFNTLGQGVKTFHRIIGQAGHYTMQWDGRVKDNTPAPSGIYFYRLKTKDFYQTRSMILLR